MFLQVRQCCCSLATFVKVTNIVSTVVYFCFALAAVLWFLLFSSDQFNSSSTDEDYQGSANLTILIVALVFIVVGVAVNLMSLWAVKAKKRSLILPWLVFHAVLTTGEIELPRFTLFLNAFTEHQRRK